MLSTQALALNPAATPTQPAPPKRQTSARLAAWCSASAVALLLAACGGASGSAADSPAVVSVAPADKEALSTTMPAAQWSSATSATSTTPANTISMAKPLAAAAPLPAASGSCGAGSATTAWAEACAPKATCTLGRWNIADGDGLAVVQHQTAHFALRWRGEDITLAQATDAGKALEGMWGTYVNRVGFAEPYCEDKVKYKVNVNIDPSFRMTGGPVGERELAMWINPAALQDHWRLAEELAHLLQGATRGLRDSVYVGWMWESHASWMAHQLPEFRGNLQCADSQSGATHLYYGNTREANCNWQFWEFIKDKFCYQAVNDIWQRALRPHQNGFRNEDPFSVLARNMGWTVSQLNDVFGEWALHNVNWDYRNLDGSDQGAVYRARYGSSAAHVADHTLRVTQLDPIDKANRRFAVPPAWAPQRWGYNTVRLMPDAGATRIDVSFRGVVQAAPANNTFSGLINEPTSVPSPDSDWRWGLVAVDAAGRSRYSELMRDADDELSFCLQPGDQSVWMVVMGTPKSLHKIAWDQAYQSVYRYPWMAQFKGAWPEGYQPNAPTPTPNGRWHANGGGWVSQAANVAATAYVGPQAQVLGGMVSGNARIEDHAVVLSGIVSGHAVVGGLTVLSGHTVVQDYARVATAFKGPGAFEAGITLSGTAQLYGDAEIHGVSLARGAFTGLINAASANDARQGANLLAPPAEVTAKVNYAWRP